MATNFLAYTHTDVDTQPVLTMAISERPVWGTIHLRTAAAKSPKWVFIGEGIRVQDMPGCRTVPTATLQAAQTELGLHLGRHNSNLADYGITKNKTFFLALTVSQALLDSI